MLINSDLHIHGRFSRATSKNLDFPNLEKYARIKGISLLGTGDFTHPKWLADIIQNFTERDGILYTKTGFPFLLTSEVSLIYTDRKLGEGKRIHLVLLAPSMEVVKQINDKLLKFGRLDYDGRPIFKIQPDDFVTYMKEIHPDIEIIPAHIWTPWFALFGSESGYDDIEDCFKDQTRHIFALETGLSSDPMMNWQLSKLDKYNLVSFSDSHSFWPWRIGRESTVLNVNALTYSNIIKALHNVDANNSDDSNRILATMEFWPEEGKYHYDGHRNCDVSFNPEQTLKHNNKCPKCNKQLTLGVLYRVNELADRQYGYIPKTAKPFINTIPLAELVAHSLGTATTSKSATAVYYNMIKQFGNEYNILFNASEHELASFAKSNNVNLNVAKTIIENRNFSIFFKPGFDGEYGKIIEDKKVDDELRNDNYYFEKLKFLKEMNGKLKNNNIYIGLGSSSSTVNASKIEIDNANNAGKDSAERLSKPAKKTLKDFI